MSSLKKKILIAHAFFLNNDSKQLEDKFKPYPPLATLYAASLLRAEGHEIALFDAVLANDLTEFDNIFLTEKPSILVIYEDDFNFLTKMCLAHVRDATLKMIDRAKSQDVTVIVHSSDASDNPDIYLGHGADYIIYGEGEQTLAEIVDYCFNRNKQPIDEIHGICYLKNGALKKTPARKTLRYLDELPQPAWDLIDFNKYRQAWNKRHEYFSINMVTTRGCPYKCNWCAKPIWGQQYHSHSPAYIAKQLEWLVKNAMPNHIWFADDIFGLKKGWIETFAKELKQLNIKVPFMIQSRADLIDEKVVRALKEAGCQEVWLGVESGSQAVLDSMDKQVQLSQIESARHMLGQANIKVGFFIQLGYPGEDVDEIEQTRQMIIDMKPEEIGVSVSYPLPGTLFYQKVKNQMTAKTHWLESNDLDTVFSTTFSREFYQNIREHLHGELQCHGLAVEVANWNKKWHQLIQSADQYRVTQPAQIHPCFEAVDQERQQKSGLPGSSDRKIEIEIL